MIFFFKKNKLIVDCFTCNKAAYEIFPVEHAKKFYPSWWKNIPPALPNPKHSSDITAPTLRGCTGFIDYYQTGMIIPLWTQIIIEIGSLGSTFLRVAMANPQSDAEQHPEEQRGSFLPEKEYSHVKLTSPWHIEANKAVPFIMLKPIWNFEKPDEFILPPGSLNFYYQHASNINVFFKREKNDQYLNLNAGIPMAHLVPQTQEELVIKHHFLSIREYEQRAMPPFKFTWINSYKKYVSFKKKRD